MKRIISWAILATVLGALVALTSPTHARTPGFIDQSDSFISYSVGYEFSTGNYQPLENSAAGDTTLDQAMTTFQVSVRPTYYTQFFAVAGLERNTFGDTETQSGTLTGGGGEILLDQADDIYLKAIGSIYLHDTLDVSGSSSSLEFKQDWQGGFLLGRAVDQDPVGNFTSHYDAYMGVLYSDRRADLTTGGTTTELEQADANGGSIFAGANWRYSRAVRLELEGEVGAMTSGSFRLIYTF